MTHDEIIEMAEQAGMTQDGNMWFSNGKEDMDVEHKHLVAFANLVAAKEREACAVLTDARLEKWASLFGKDKMYKWMLGLPKAIRARGEQA
jgi:alkylhydroperoxidase/carboxymuconolactone decarboxylase family protein YurZ